MKYGIVSDIHANPVALTRVLEECDRLGVEQVVCAGDVVGYGPDPAGAIRILRERNIPTVMGNHDAAVASLRSETSMSESGQTAVLRHRCEVGEDDMKWLQALPFVYEGDGFAVAHANFRHPEEMEYVQDWTDARASFVSRDEFLLFIGHTHVETLFAFGMPGNLRFPECRQVAPRDFRKVDGWQYLVNVGSVGYPRVHPYSTFATFDSETGIVRYHHVEFDFKAYAGDLGARSIPLPPWVVERI